MALASDLAPCDDLVCRFGKLGTGYGTGRLEVGSGNSGRRPVAYGSNARLHRGLYGLKQAPRAWFHRFSAFLFATGFSCSRIDSSLFVLSKGADLIYLLLYVDDIVVTSNNSVLLNAFISKLSKEFATKDMGSLIYFLGLEEHRTSSGLFISQAKYAHEILQRAKLVDSKPMSTPMVVAHHLSTDGPDFDDPSLYQSLVGSLQYLTITRLDLAHAVSAVSQYMHKPSLCHFQAVKQILRYIKGTLRYGLSFTPSSSCNILAYSDADWAGRPDTQRSISGYAIYLGDNLVSWHSKNNRLCLIQAMNPNTERLPALLSKSSGLVIFFVISR
ncbi:uncharacterized mitochondrial protein AtMg00810-like [Carya illinoinensis]|uniref:uncharacterized mitochondrial protein AtMg00810-like n=1 Tax=Carya illinoinensis TaxID=32201 RepID=UPI001C71E8B4|nr:uncharacterized mitochondrial protein AtMg00810-like [Carya illinoinensis]